MSPFSEDKVGSCGRCPGPREPYHQGDGEHPAPQYPAGQWAGAEYPAAHDAGGEFGKIPKGGAPRLQGGGGLAEWQRAGKSTEMGSVEFARGLSNEKQLLEQRIRQLQRDRKLSGTADQPSGELQRLRTRLKELQ